MANTKNKKEFKKPIQKEKIEEKFVEDENNKKVILIICLSILVVLGLIIGSVYYFGNEDKERNNEIKEPEIKDPIIEVEEDEEEERVEEEKPIVILTPTESEEETAEEENVQKMTFIFYNENGEKIGEQVIEDGVELEYPEVEEKEGYNQTWVAECDDETDTCKLTIQYDKILVMLGEDKDYEVTLTNETIKVTGTVFYEETPRENFLGTDYNNYIKIKFLSPDELTSEQIRNMTVTVTREGLEGGYTYNGDGVLDSTEEEKLAGNYYFFLEQAVDKGTTETPTIIIDWDGDGKLKPYTYTIDLSELHRVNRAEHNGITVPTEEATEGEEPTYDITGGQKPTYEVDLEERPVDPENPDLTEEVIVVEGKVNNYINDRTGTMATVGLDEYNHIITLKFTAPEGITDFANMKVSTSTNEYVGDILDSTEEERLGGNYYFYLYQAVDKGTTEVPTITIDWDGNGELESESYVIDLSKVRLELFMETEGLSKVETVEGEQELKYDLGVSEDRNGVKYIEVTGEVNYYAEGEIQVEAVAGNYVSVKFTAPESVTDTSLMQVTYEGNTYGNEILDIESNSFTINANVTSGENVTINVSWDGVNTTTYEIDLTNATLTQFPTIGE